jgi:phage-related protein
LIAPLLETAHANERHCYTRHWKLSTCFQEILHAFTLIRPAPGTQALESLSVVSYDGKKRRVFGVGLKDIDDLQEKSQYFTPLQPVLAGVCQLKLAVELGNKYGPGSSTGRNPNLETWLSVFLKLVPRLETLHLYLDGWSQVQWRPRYTQRYLYHEAMALFLWDSQLQYLSHLKLCGLTIRADNFQHFVTFLERHAGRTSKSRSS